MSKSLAVKYRPTDWSEVYGQKSTIKILQQELETNSFKNCYLFCGPSGDGKTTIARILASKVNKGKGQPIEVDGASNNSVDNVRSIIKASQERAIDSEYKIFIIDECHALSNAAWQAFLKSIEEPSKYTIYIFCTTDPQKIPATILNRVERFNLSRLSVADIQERLSYICDREGLTNYAQSVEYIAKISNGGMRDAIAYIDKCSSYSKDLSIENVLEAIGNFSYDNMFKLLNAFIDNDISTILSILSKYSDKGFDMKLFIDQFISFVIDVSKFNLFKNFNNITIPKYFEEELKHTVAIENASNYFLYILDKLLNLKATLRNDSDINSTIQIVFMQIAQCK